MKKNSTYIALLRGINVSGQKKILMADLRKLLESKELQDVSTYIQSGNIIFQDGKRNEDELKKLINEAIQDHYGFNVPVLILTPKRIKHAIASNPFNDEAEFDPKRVYFTFLDSLPNQKDVQQLLELDYSPEQIEVKDSVVYFFSPKEYGKAKMSNNFIEKKLKVSATSRNWKTTHILFDLAKKVMD